MTVQTITPPIAPAENTGSPESPLNPCSRLSPSAPTIQTTGSELPSLVVTMGEPAPLTLPHHACVMVGRLPELIFKTVSWCSDAGGGQETPGPCNATYVLPAIE